MHASGVHATVAGVLLGFAVPVLRSRAAGGPEAGPGLAEHFEHRFRPISAGVAVPVFALMSAGVAIGGLERPGARRSPIRSRSASWSGWWSASRSASPPRPGWSPGSPGPKLDAGLAWIDVVGLAVLAGIGFTVSLLIGELAFGIGSDRDDHVKVARAGRLAGRRRCWPRSSCGCATAPTGGSTRPRPPTRDRDGIPDVYQQDAADRPDADSSSPHPFPRPEQRGQRP